MNELKIELADINMDVLELNAKLQEKNKRAQEIIIELAKARNGQVIDAE